MRLGTNSRNNMTVLRKLSKDLGLKGEKTAHMIKIFETLYLCFTGYKA